MELKDDFMVFSGTANLPLAEKVANYLGRPLNKIDVQHFPDGETFCQVQEGVRGKDVFVIQSGSPAPNDAYMEPSSAAARVASRSFFRTTAMPVRTARTSRGSRLRRVSSRTSSPPRALIAS